MIIIVKINSISITHLLIEEGINVYKLVHNGKPYFLSRP